MQVPDATVVTHNKLQHNQPPRHFADVIYLVNTAFLYKHRKKNVVTRQFQS